MNQNIRIARNLVRIARELVAGSEEEQAFALLKKVANGNEINQDLAKRTIDKLVDQFPEGKRIVDQLREIGRQAMIPGNRRLKVAFDLNSILEKIKELARGNCSKSILTALLIAPAVYCPNASAGMKSYNKLVNEFIVKTENGSSSVTFEKTNDVNLSGPGLDRKSDGRNFSINEEEANKVIDQITDDGKPVYIQGENDVTYVGASFPLKDGNVNTMAINKGMKKFCEVLSRNSYYPEKMRITNAIQISGDRVKVVVGVLDPVDEVIDTDARSKIVSGLEPAGNDDGNAGGKVIPPPSLIP